MLANPRKISYSIQSLIWLSLLLRLWFLGNHDLQAEEAYYWNYAAHLDFGYLDHPPMVAVLIKLSTLLFGLNEFAVRFPAILCWGIAAWYLYRWAELVTQGCGQFAVLLLSILPFFFIDSCIMTPDIPMLAAWSASLYYLYRALCLRDAGAWYGVGISLGLGLVAKYSIGLVILSTGILVLTHHEHRKWLWRKEPYLAAVLCVLLFSPVLYWNHTHHWVSFSFQSTRRLHGNTSFSLQELSGWLLVFLTPVGVIGLFRLFKPSFQQVLPTINLRFLQVYTLIPLLVYAAFSCFHGTKFNWIGPGLLAVLPWLAYLMHQHSRIHRQWIKTAPILFATYALIMACISCGKPEFLNQLWFTKMLSWQQLTTDLYHIAAAEQSDNSQPVLMPLDLYGIASELTYYQRKLAATNPQLKPFSVVQKGLMFGFWTDSESLHGQKVILISPVKARLTNPPLPDLTQPLSPIQTLWAVSQGTATRTIPFYYQIIRVL